MKISGKTILVTGAGGGIGRELVLALISGGAKVVAVDLKAEFLEDLKKTIKEDKNFLITRVLDITKKEEVEGLVEDFSKEKIYLDGIINNAGIIQPFAKVNDLDYSAVERVMNVNFYGPLFLIKSFLPQLLSRPEAHIVNVSSMGGFLPVPGQSVYGASKAALKLLTEGLYAELKNTNVKVSAVFPGATKTNIATNSGLKNMSQKNQDSSQKIPTLSPQKVAQIIVSGIKKDKFQIFTGGDSKFMNFLYRLSPKFATNFIAKKMSSLLEKR